MQVEIPIDAAAFARTVHAFTVRHQTHDELALLGSLIVFWQLADAGCVCKLEVSCGGPSRPRSCSD